MNTTAANVLKILSQTEMSIEDMHMYLNIEKNAILKTISQINDFLESLNLPKIEKKEDIFQLILTKEQWKKLFDNFNILTAEERIDYLYIKFIAHGFLNLEKEKEILDLSRSTILRCFQSVKEDFVQNGTKYEYLHGKGLLMTELSYQNKKLFYKKVMKLFIEEDILVPPLKSLLMDIKKFDTKTRLTQLHPILKFSKIPMNYFLIAFLHSLEACCELFEESLFKKEHYLDTKEFKEIRELIDQYGKDFSPKFKEEMTYFLTTLLLDYYSLENEDKKKSLHILKELEKEFKISKINKDLEKMIFHNIYLSFFKFENKILKLRNTSFDEKERVLLDKLNYVLEKNSCDFFLGDKFSIVFALKRALIEENFSKIKNVLLVLNQPNATHYKIFENSLNKIAPHINFDLESSLFHLKNLLTDFNNYDLIISDEHINSNVAVIDFYCNSKIQTILEEKAFSMGIQKFYDL